jgi:seryl-tRNA synthetase
MLAKDITVNAIRYEILTIDSSLRWDKDVFKSVHESLPYFVNGFVLARFRQDGLEIEHHSHDASAKILEDVQALIFRISESFRDAEERVFISHAGLDLIADKDPYVSLLEDGRIVPTGRGKFVYSGDFLVALKAFDRMIQDLAFSLDGIEELYPTTVNTQTLLDAGYLSSFPHHAFFAAPAHLDAKSLSVLSAGDVLTRKDREATVQHLGFPGEILAPTVCYHCFEARRDLKIKKGVVTALNKCHRHEPVNVNSLQRLTTYWMREIIIFDNVEQVQAALDKILEWTVWLLSELNVSFKVVSANDPFFADSSSDKRLFQNAYELKKEIKIPVFGGNWISVGSFNNHQSSIVTKFNILDESGNSVTSGCAGWGLERLLYGVFSHLGAGLEDWPQSAKTLLKI